MAANREDILLITADKMLDMCKGKKNKIFDGFYPLACDLYEEDEGVFFMDVKPTDLNERVNISLLRMFESGHPKEQFKDKPQWYRFREISSKELRKRTGLYSPYKTYCFELGFETDKKSYKFNDAYFRYIDGEMKALTIPGTENNQRVMDEVKLTAQICMAAQFNLENQPYVYLKPGDGEIGFKMPLDTLDQLKSLFAMRDIPEGYKRRAALRNWVSKHMRRKPGKPDEYTEIRRHLRGKTEFSWNGMSGYISVN